MTKYFSAQISQDHAQIVKNLALNLNVPADRIVFKREGCPLGSIGVYIKFDNQDSLNEFCEKMQDINCILKRW